MSAAADTADSTKCKSPEPEAKPMQTTTDIAIDVPMSAAADTTDSTKRKSPELEAKPMQTTTDVAIPVDATSVDLAKPAGAEPPTKRLKASPAEPAAVRKQLEYYLSDENLKYDKFFHDKISGDAEGWLDLALILSCNKMKAMRASMEDVLSSLKGSKLEIGKDKTAVRRPGNAALPSLESKPAHHQKKSSIHAHDGGVVSIFSNIPEEQSWVQLKGKVKEALPDKVNVWFCSEVSDKNECTVVTAPFEGDCKFFEELSLELGGAKLTCIVAQNERLQCSLKMLPRHIKDKRDKCARQRAKERNRPIVLGTMKFINIAALRGRVREIMNSRTEGEPLKAEGADFKLIVALLKYHPKGEEKTKGLKGLKVAKSDKGDNRCFYLIREDGSEDDFSIKKCLDALEANPPYEEKPADKNPIPVAKDAKDPPGASSAPSQAGATKQDEPKTEDPPVVSPAASQAGATKQDEPKKEDPPAASSAPPQAGATKQDEPMTEDPPAASSAPSEAGATKQDEPTNEEPSKPQDGSKPEEAKTE